MAIIRSILDTDLYKFTTSYAYSKLFPRAFGEFEFVDRNNLHFPAGFDKLVRRELESMADLFLTKEEELFLKNKLPYLPPTYIEFFERISFRPGRSGGGDDRWKAVHPLFRTPLPYYFLGNTHPRHCF